MRRPLPFDPLVDQISAHLSAGAVKALREDSRRIVITGPGGWLGRATLDLITNALGVEEAHRRVHCFGSQTKRIELERGVQFEQLPLASMAYLSAQPTMVLHLAFLTKDKVANMDEAEYGRANRALSRMVADCLDTIGADRLFLASSGAAAYADDPEAAADLRLYGRLKRDDEELFSAWAEAQSCQRRALISRIFSLSGPYINKHQTYALASFILDALSGRTICVNAPTRVVRSYVAIRELMSLVFTALLADDENSVVRFDSGGMPMELSEVAACVADVIGPLAVNRNPLGDGRGNQYSGDGDRYQNLLSRYGVDPVDIERQVAETAAYLARKQVFES